MFTISVLELEKDKTKSKKAQYGVLSANTSFAFESAEGSPIKLVGKSRS